MSSMKFKGVSFYISFGLKKGFKLFERDGPSIRIRLWIVSFCITLTDVERIIKDLLNELREHDDKEGHVEQEIAKLNSERGSLEGLKEELENQRKEIERKLQELKERKEELEETEDIEEKLSRSIEVNKQYVEQIDNLESHISDLSDEIDEYEQTDNENEELRDKVNVLQKEIVRLRFELEYLEIYFNLR